MNLPLEKLGKENFSEGYSVAAPNTVSNQGNVPFWSKPQFSYKEPLVNIEVKSEVKKPVSPLNPSASAFQYSLDFLNPIPNTHGSAGRVFKQTSALPPGPKLTLECFDGDILIYFGFK